jgi:hypothetical protein
MLVPNWGQDILSIIIDNCLRSSEWFFLYIFFFFYNLNSDSIIIHSNYIEMRKEINPPGQRLFTITEEIWRVE